MQEASKKLTESLHEVYEPDWYGREDVKVVGEVRIYLFNLIAPPFCVRKSPKVANNIIKYQGKYP